MKNAFSIELPDKTSDLISSLLKEINFFNKSPSKLDGQVKRNTF